EGDAEQLAGGAEGDIGHGHTHVADHAGAARGDIDRAEIADGVIHVHDRHGVGDASAQIHQRHSNHKHAEQPGHVHHQVSLPSAAVRSWKYWGTVKHDPLAAGT